VRRLLPLLLLPALAACKVERTPPELLTHRDPAVVEAQEDARELRARVLNFAVELSRGDRAGAVQVLVPHPMVYVFGTGAHGGLVGIGPNDLAAAVEEMRAGAGPSLFRTPDLRVESDGDLGWFSTHLERIGPAPERMRMSGVFARQEGAWRLVQLHLSRPFTEPRPEPLPPRPSPDSAADADSAAGG
jgi:hypothetical protein